jgi:gamma-glutamylcyclotransferase (GGCT)/AIG2-like uncharacterized protein YtfP
MATRKQKDFLFVYGTLRKGAAHRMHETLSRYSESGCNAFLQAKLYDLGEYPAAVISEHSADVVVGELHALDPERSAEALAILDEYEGVNQQAPGMFRRERQVVTLEDGTRMEAWVYVYVQDPPNRNHIRSGDYLAHVKSRIPNQSKE